MALNPEQYARIMEAFDILRSCLEAILDESVKTTAAVKELMEAQRKDNPPCPPS